MDGSNTTPGTTHTSITAAMNDPFLVTGSTVLIKGLQFGGLPVGYSNLPFFGSQGAETFPIIIPAGITVKNYDGNAVYVYPVSLQPSALFDLRGTQDGAQVTLIQRIAFLGGTIGVRANQALPLPVQPFLNFELRTCLFHRNAIGVSVIADDGEAIFAEIVNASFQDTIGPLVQAPALQTPGIGIQFHAIEDTGIPRIEATVANLTSVGDWQSLAPQPYLGDLLPDLRATFPAVSRLVEVFTDGRQREHPASPFVSEPIAEVILDVQGGVWDGHDPVAPEGGGWDVGLYAANDAETESGEVDYRSGYSVTITGTEIRDFGVAGVLGTSSVDARGEIHLRGQTKLHRTGLQLAASPDGYSLSGAHMYCVEGYLALTGADATFADNRGNGVWLHCPGTVMADTDFPMGLYLGLLRSEVHRNGLDGIAMEAGTPDPESGFRQEAIVGGTWDTFGGTQRRLGASGVQPTNLFLGQGGIDRCGISNNGGVGIRARVKGRPNDPGDPLDAFTVASCRVVNSLVWNNPGGGFLADLEGVYGKDSANPLLLTPLVHCTVVGNGDATGFSVEVNDNSPIFPGTYEFTEVAGDPLLMRVFDSILQRKNPLDEDFGPNLRGTVSDTSLERDESDIGNVSDHRIGIEGLRAVVPSWIEDGPLYWNTFQDITPLFQAGTIVWTSTVKSQFYLVTGGPPGPLDSCPDWNDAAPDLSNQDVQGDIRPTNLLLRDRGADQVWP